MLPGRRLPRYPNRCLGGSASPRRHLWASRHRELVKAGTERVRKLGERIGRPSVTERDGFAERFGEVVERIGPRGLSHRQAAREFDIGYCGFSVRGVLPWVSSFVGSLQVEVEPPIWGMSRRVQYQARGVRRTHIPCQWDGPGLVLQEADSGIFRLDDGPGIDLQPVLEYLGV